MSGRMTKALAVSALLCAAAAYPSAAMAQQRPAPPASPRPGAARPAPRPQTAIRGFGDFGAERFAAGDTFDATLGSPTGIFFGGGVEVVLPQRWFISARLSHFQKSGERVFVDSGEVFPLGIDMKVGITPIEVSVGYRFQPRGSTSNVIPYVGGGIGWHRYSETSDFADTGEDVSETFQGYHVLGGAEFRMGRIFAIAGEGQWTTIPNAFEGAASSAADAFGESNLGGIAFRVRFVVGR